MLLATRLCAALLVVGLSIPLASARLYALSYGQAGSDAVQAIAPYPDGGSVVVGRQWLASGEGEQMWIARLNRVGNPIWQLTVGGAGQERGLAVDATDAGEIYVAGTTSDGAGGLDLLVLRLSGSGAVLAESVFGEEGDETPRDLRVFRDAVVIVGEATRSGEGDAGLALELDATSLVTRWSFSYRAVDADVEFRALELRPGELGDDPTYLVVGTAVDASGGGSGVLLAELDTRGTPALDARLWQIDERESGFDLVRTSTGRTVVVGDALDADQRARMLVFALDPSLALDWARLFHVDDQGTTGRGIAAAPFGHTVVTGRTSLGNGDLAALRLSATGSVLAERRYGATSVEDDGRAVVFREDCEGGDGFLFGGATRSFTRGGDDALVVQTDDVLLVNSACPYETSLGVLVDVPALFDEAIDLQIDPAPLVNVPAPPAATAIQSPIEGCRSVPCEVSSSWSTSRGGLPLTLRNLGAGEIGCEWMPAPEVAATFFNRYEGFMSEVQQGFYGEPVECGIPAEPFIDGAESICADLLVLPGRVLTVLITAGNEWGEGPLGRDSFGNVRPNRAPCP